MLESVRSALKRFSHAHLIGALIGATSLAYLPTSFSPGAFDRNAAPQFISLVATAFVCGILLFRLKRIELSKYVAWAIAALFTTSLISLLWSDSLLTGLIGDTGRFSGAISLWSLLIVAITFSQLTKEQFLEAALGATVGIVSVTLLGFLQSINLITLPTGGGVGSTLGNLDFLSAFIGTTILLVFIYFTKIGYPIWVFIVYVALSIFTLWKIDAKQGFLDLAIATALLLLLALSKRLNLAHLSGNALKVIATFLLILWSEAIYLIPMANIKIPGIGDDVNVRIRSDFWYSAAHMFFDHLGFGVGPDNFGNYYEKYRSLNSVRNYEFIVANDAHSSMLQTFATLGIFATFSFLLLILFAVYAFIDLAKFTGDRRYWYLLIAFVAFYTNSLISPITLPNKLIFWAIAGFAIGRARALRQRNSSADVVLPTRIPAALMTAVLLLPTLSFTQSFVALNSSLSDSISGKKVSYKVSSNLPCVIYIDAQMKAIEASGGNIYQASQLIVGNYPRCLNALGYLTKDAITRKDYVTAKPYIYSLLDVAPARQSVIHLAALYALGANDVQLQHLLSSQGIKLGLIASESNG